MFSAVTKLSCGLLVSLMLHMPSCDRVTQAVLLLPLTDCVAAVRVLSHWLSHIITRGAHHMLLHPTPQASRPAGGVPIQHPSTTPSTRLKAPTLTDRYPPARHTESRDSDCMTIRQRMTINPT
jgi:hypothetical protein